MDHSKSIEIESGLTGLDPETTALFLQPASALTKAIKLNLFPNFALAAL
jgi:hypothetical protein